MINDKVDPELFTILHDEYVQGFVSESVKYYDVFKVNYKEFAVPEF